MVARTITTQQLVHTHVCCLADVGCGQRAQNIAGGYFGCPAALLGDSCTASCSPGYVGAPNISCVLASNGVAAWTAQSGTCTRSKWCDSLLTHRRS